MKYSNIYDWPPDFVNTWNDCLEAHRLSTELLEAIVNTEQYHKESIPTQKEALLELSKRNSPLGRVLFSEE